MSDRSAPVFFVKIFQGDSATATRVDVSDRITSFTFDDGVDKGAYKIELDVDNFDLSLFDDPLWRAGNQLDVSWGYAGNMAPTREGVIRKITGFSVLKIDALAKSILMNREVRSEVFNVAKRSEVAQQIAMRNGYGPNEQQIDDTAIVCESVSQTRLTDAQFMASLAAKEGFQFYVDFDGFHFHRRRMNQAPRRVFVYYNDQTQGDIISISVENDVTAKPGAVTAVSRDPRTRKDIRQTADDKSTKRDVLSPTTEIQPIDAATGQKLARRAGSAVVLSTAKTDAAAKREADNRFIQTQQTAVKIAMSVVGDPQVAAKTVIEIKNISKRLSGKYFVSSVTHKLSASDYTMEIKCHTDGTNDHKNPATSGSKNDKKPGDPKANKETKVVNEKTGETQTVYKKP